MRTLESNLVFIMILVQCTWYFATSRSHFAFIDFKYRGVQLDRRLNFGENLKIATAKDIQCRANLDRLMPNDGLREAKRRLVASVVHSKLLYAAPAWANALQNHATQRKLFSAQRSVALRIVSAYRTVSTSAVLVLSSVPPINLLAEESQETFQLRKELTCTDLQEIARAKEPISHQCILCPRDLDAVSWLADTWRVVRRMGLRFLVLTSMLRPVLEESRTASI